MEYFSKILHIDYNESAHSVIERFMTLDDHDIIFTIPIGSDIFQSVPELKLLKQAVDKSGKNVVLVSQDQEGMALARDLGFRVEQEFLELIAPDEESHRYSADTHKHPRISDILYPKRDAETARPAKKIVMEEIAPEEAGHPIESIRKSVREVEEVDESVDSSKDFFSKKSTSAQEIPRKRHSISITVIIAAFMVLAIGVAGVAMMIVLPEATLGITPKKETVILEIPIKADTSASEINFETNVIPGQIVKVEKEKDFQFKSTGKSTGQSKAVGKITVYNEHTPPQSQALVKTTRFQAPDGKIFKTTQSIIVPEATIVGGKTIPGTIEVEVLAESAGPEYNIGPAEFSIPGLSGTPKSKSIYGKSSEPIQGGSKGDGPMVTLDDINNAKTQAENELLGAVKNELLEKLPKDLETAEDSLETKIVEEKISVSAGSAVGEFSISLKVSSTAFLFQEEDLKSLIEKNIENKLMREKITYKELRRTYGNVDADFQGGTMSLTAKVEQDIAAFIDIEDLRNKVAGKDENAIRDIILAEDSIEVANVSLKPKFFLKKAPSNIDKINIVIED